MYGTYSSSGLWSIRNKGFHDYSCLFPVRSERCTFALSSSSSRCCCASSRSCCCCYSESSSSYVKHKVSIQPRFVLYGLRQSTLFQWPPFRRRLLVGGGDRLVDRFLGCEFDGDCCEVSCSCRERCRGCRSFSERRNWGFRFRVSEESHECHNIGDLDDAEAFITLLSEECSCGKGRDRSLGRGFEKKKRVKNGGERNGGNVRRVEIEEKTNERNGRSTQKNKREEGDMLERFDREQKRGNRRTEEEKVRRAYDSEHSGGRKRSSGLEIDLLPVYKSDVLEFRGETSSKNERREGRVRWAKNSSCSSCYSLSSSGEFKSDTEGHQDDNQGKSKKRLDEVSNNELESSREASRMHLRRRTEQNSYGVSSNYCKQVYEEEENSNQAMALEQRRRKWRSQTGDRVSESRRNHEEDTEIHEIHVNDLETNSQNQKCFSSTEDNTVVSVRSDVDRENIQYTGRERVSRTQRHSKYSNIQEEDVKVARNSVQKIKEQQRQTEESIFRQAELKGTTERFSEESRIHATEFRNTYLPHTEKQEKSRVEYASLVSGSLPEVKEQHHYTDQAPLQKIQSGEKSVPISHSSDIIRVTESHRTSEKRIIGQENTITSIVQLAGEAKESAARKDSRVEHTNSRKEDHKAYKLHSPQEKVFEASSSQSSFTSVSRDRIQQVCPDGEEIRDSKTILIPPLSQLVSRGSGRSYRSGGALIQDASFETSDAGYGEAYYSETGASVNSQSPGEILSLTTHEDALGSAQQSEQSSMQLIEEFMETVKQKTSIPEIQKERTENSQLKRWDSKQSSGVSGAKGPSDEMWVTGPSAQETPQTGAPEGTAAGGHAIVKRSGRPLWSIIADIARLRWGSRAGTTDSAAKGPFNETSSSETWFSGEHGGNSDDNAKGDKRALPREAASTHQPGFGQISSGSQFESSSSVNFKQQSGQDEVQISSSSGRLEGGSASRRISSESDGVEEVRSSQNHPPETDAAEMPLLLPAIGLRRSPVIKEPSESSPIGVSGDQNIGLYEERRSFQSRLPEIDAVQMPLLRPGRNLRTSPVKEPSEYCPTVVSGSSSLREQVEKQPPVARSDEETVTLASDSVLKQRKLQRNKQVTRDSFEEWEEAYRIEAERRKADEKFMREAILEAKKAADIWEIPVGAVLVHEGKIIARGCNLVEDLRDSTAHAEMICIREGSKVLHSWRLADTTLYVTLEPCPMCAGAILQARVNTLVWGAPNKLLGADGSWIRLFPGEGNGSDKPPAPVHPFHPKMTVRQGVLESECAEAMQQLFQLRRKKKDKTPDKNPEPPTPPSRLPASHHHHSSKLLHRMHHFFHFMFCL